MRLGVYLKKNNISVKTFAGMIEVHPMSVYRFIKGMSFPRCAILIKIRDATGGEVNANDFMNFDRPFQ